MTRTYVVGDVPEELREYHRLAKEALDRATAAAGPGVDGLDLMRLVCDLFAEHGYTTPLTKKPGEVIHSGFFHGLGHGVGLEVHERPHVSRTSDKLLPGDVITIEPGLYRGATAASGSRTSSSSPTRAPDDHAVPVRPRAVAFHRNPLDVRPADA